MADDTTTTTDEETEGADDEGILTEKMRTALLSSAPMVVRVILKNGDVLDRGDEAAEGDDALGTLWRAFGKRPGRIEHFVVHTNDRNLLTHVDVYARFDEASELGRRGRVSRVTLFGSVVGGEVVGFVQTMVRSDAQSDRETAVIAKQLAFAATVRRAQVGAPLDDEDEGQAIDIVDVATQLVAHRNMPPKQAAKVAQEIILACDELGDEEEPAKPGETK